MTGADIIGAMLLDDDDVTDLVPAAQIKGGRLPEKCPLDVILVRTVSSVDRPTLSREATVRRTDRVSVAVRAESYRGQKAIIAAVRSCCSGREGDLGGGRNVAVTSAGLGPDMDGPGNSFEQTQDFRVSFDGEY